jgi:hypothetical protein
MLADLSVAANATEDASRYAEDGLKAAAAHGAALNFAPLHRIHGDALIVQNPAAAEKAYRESIRIARKQGARAFELQASLRFGAVFGRRGRIAF